MLVVLFAAPAAGDSVVTGTVFLPGGSRAEVGFVSISNAEYQKITLVDTNGDYQFQDPVPNGSYAIRAMGSSRSESGSTEQSLVVDATTPNPLTVNVSLVAH